MRRSLRARVLSSLASFALLGCSRSPRIEERPLYVYSPRSCPVSQSQAFGTVYAGGDFEGSVERPAVASLFLRDVGTALEDLPKETRSLLVDVSQPSQNIDWRGVTEIPSSGPIHVLVWPGGEACRLTRNVDRRAESTLGVFGRHLMVAGGKLLEGPQVPHTHVGDLSTGILERLAFGLGTRRSRPTITAFRTTRDEDPSPALVAGGTDPDSGAALGSAEIYVPRAGTPGDLGDVGPQRIDLSEPRAGHGAVVLVTGETLLVGGVGQSGAPLRTMEIVDPKTRRTRTSGTALLAVARTRPSVLRLASGEILVAGGTDSKGNAVPTLEWFSADAARPSRRPTDLVTGRERAFVALEAGGALAVVVPDAPSPDFKNVWVISAEGALEPAVPIDPAILDHPRLFAGAEGSPVLFTGSRWLRWQPWFGVFQPIADAPATGPVGEAIANGDSGLSLWLEDRNEAGMYVTGFRFATRSRFGAVPKPLLTDGPSYFAPDRLAGGPASTVRFDRDLGLLLGPGASAFVTDLTFAGFQLSLDVSLTAPVVVLRDDEGREFEIGGASCAFAQSAKRRLDVARSGKRVRVAVDGGEWRACPDELAPETRVALGIRGAQGVGTSGSQNLRIERR